MKNPPAIEIENVFKSFKETKAVNGISMSVDSGTYLALLGPNGAGKTTLVEMIEGIQKPDRGEIRILGKNWKQNEAELRNILGFSFQETRFIDKLTTKETLNLFASFYKIKSNGFHNLLEITGLHSKLDTYVENLSGGQRQKLALCIALVHGPKILILDEPTTGLDPTARREIWEVLTKLKSQSTTLILTTHYMEEAEKLCDRIVFVNQGTVIAEGSMKEILAKNEQSEFILLEFEEPVSSLSLESFPGFIKCIWDESRRSVKVFISDTIGFLEKFISEAKKQNIKIRSLECKKMTLDDYFISMTGRSLEDK